MTIVGLHDFVKVSISALLRSFLLIMCIDAPESTTNSRSSGLWVDAGRHLFSEGEKNVALWCSFNFNTLLAGFHAASWAPCSCHSVSSWDRLSNFGALGLRSWGSPGQIYPSEGFWSRILVWRATAFVNFARWIGFRMSEQTFLQTGNHSWSCRTSILEGAIFDKMSYCKFLWGNPCKAIETFYHYGILSSGTSGSRWFSLILLHERIRRRIWWWTFPTLIQIVAETAIVSFHTLPVGFPLPTISKNSLYTLFCSLILDHGVLLKISISVPKILISHFLLDTSLHHSFQSVTIRS